MSDAEIIYTDDEGNILVSESTVEIIETVEETTIITQETAVTIIESIGVGPQGVKGDTGAGLLNGELNLTPKASSTGAEGTIFYNSSDNYVYVGVE